MATKAYPLRIPEEIINLAKLRSQDEYVDQATAIRQLLYLGAEEYVTRLVSQGRITINQAAKLLNTTIYDIYRIAEKHGLKLGASEQQRKKSSETLKRIIEAG